STYGGPLLGSWQVLCSYPIPTGDASVKDIKWRHRAEQFVSAHKTRLPVVLVAREGRTWGLFRPFQQWHLDASIGSPLWVERLRLFAYWAAMCAAVVGA